MAVLLGGCSLSTPLSDDGDAFVAGAQPALEVYMRATALDDGRAEQSLETASRDQRRAVEEAARGGAADRAAGIPAATAAYQATLAVDVTNALAAPGLALLGQPIPVPSQPVATQPPDPSWWAAPWQYFLGSVLVSALLAAAVLWFVERRMASGFRTMKQSQQSDHVRLAELQNHIRADRALIDALKQNAAAHAQAAESAPWEWHSADTTTDHAHAKLDRTLRLQEERIDHLTDLIDLCAQTQRESTSEVVVWFEPRSVVGEPADDVSAGDDGGNGTESGANANALSTGKIQVKSLKWVKVNIFAVSIGHGQAVQEQLVIQRVIDCPIERDEAGRTDPSAHHDQDAPLTEQEPGPAETAAADSAVDRVWKRVEESWWVTLDYQGLADSANTIKNVKNGYHNLVLGKQADEIALAAGFSSPLAHVMEQIAEKVSLPGDGLFKGVRRLVQYTGIALGLMSGAPLFANACLSSLAHDLLAEVTAKAFRAAIGHALAPARSVVRLIPANELGPNGTRTQQFRSDMFAAANRQSAHERDMQEQRHLAEVNAIHPENTIVDVDKSYPNGTSRDSKEQDQPVVPAPSPSPPSLTGRPVDTALENGDTIDPTQRPLPPHTGPPVR